MCSTDPLMLRGFRGVSSQRRGSVANQNIHLVPPPGGSELQLVHIWLVWSLTPGGSLAVVAGGKSFPATDALESPPNLSKCHFWQFLGFIFLGIFFSCSPNEFKKWISLQSNFFSTMQFLHLKIKNQKIGVFWDHHHHFWCMAHSFMTYIFGKTLPPNDPPPKTLPK